MNKKIITLYSIVALFLAYIVIIYGFIGAEHTGLVKGKMKLADFDLNWWKLFFYPHIILGAIALTIGPFQFTNKSRQNPKVHKLLGRIYAAAIFLNILAVPFIARFSTGGISTEIAFLILDAFWFVTTLMALIRVYQKNIKAHKLWMIRSYAITWVFVTFRIFAAVFSIFLEASVSFPLSVYMAIFINLLFIEYYQKRKNNTVTRKTGITT